MSVGPMLAEGKKSEFEKQASRKEAAKQVKKKIKPGGVFLKGFFFFFKFLVLLIKLLTLGLEVGRLSHPLP